MSEKLVGPNASDRERKLVPKAIQLENGRPLYHALLDNPRDVVLSTTETQAVKDRLARIINIDRTGVMSCEGQSLINARQILESIERSQRHEAA